MNGVSVVIPCLNEENYIASCLHGLIQNGFDHTKLEILVVDGGSQDNTLDIVAEIQLAYSFVKVILNPKRKTPFALNLGVKNASFNNILIAGAHALYPKNYITKLDQHLNSGHIDVIGGVIETKTINHNSKTKAICYVLSHRFGVGNSLFRVGAKELMEVDTVPFGLYKKVVFEQIGFYNEALIRNHDMELSSRIKANGYRIWMDPELICTYYARETYLGLVKNNYSNGLWNIKTLFITKKFSSLGLRHYIPLLFVLSLLFPLILALLFNPLIAFLSLIAVAMYMGLIIPISLSARNTNARLVMSAFIALHLSYGWGSLMGFFAMIQKKRATVK